MAACSGRDKRGDPCGYNTFGEDRCYWHTALRTGRLVDYVESVWREPEGERSGFRRELVPIRSHA